MAAYPLFTFLISLYIFHPDVYCAAVKGGNLEVPFKTLCSRKCEGPEENIGDLNFPLYQCSCSPSCSIYGDCCFDSKYKNGPWNKTDFVCISLIGHGKYRAIAGCPLDKSSDFCIDGLGHLPPVTSRTSNTTYANIFCATCNEDIGNLVTWNVELSCPSEFNDKDSSNDTARIIFRYGDFWRLDDSDGSKTLCMFRTHFHNFSFLTDLELRSCSNMEKISDCSASWKDLYTLQMCRSYDDPIYFHDTLYQNAHCAECNYMNPTFADCIPFQVKFMVQMGLIHSSSLGQFCENRGPHTCIQTISKGRLYAFSDLLSIREKACVPPKGRRCCQGELYDYRTSRCRKVIRD